jgi:hypothetical protein
MTATTDLSRGQQLRRETGSCRGPRPAENHLATDKYTGPDRHSAQAVVLRRPRRNPQRSHPRATSQRDDRASRASWLGATTGAGHQRRRHHRGLPRRLSGHYRPSRPGRAPAGQAPAGQTLNRQASDLQVPGRRLPHQLHRYAHHQRPGIAGTIESHHQSLRARAAPRHRIDAVSVTSAISYTGKRRVLSRELLRTLAGCPAKFAVARQGPDFFYLKRQCTLSITATARREPWEETFPHRELPA